MTKEASSLMTLVENSHSDNLYSRPECHVVSKAFSISKNTATVDILLKFSDMIRQPHTLKQSAVLWCARKTICLAFSTFLSSVCLWIVLKIHVSKRLPVADSRLIGQHFGEILSPYYVLTVVIFASFEEPGTWHSQKQWLNKCAKWTRCRLGRCLRH
jgi:hypothetical protein